MSRRAVMRLTDYSETIETGSSFFQYLKELGCGPRTRFQLQKDADGNPCLVVELPESAAHALERKQSPPVRTKRQQAVHDALERRKEAVGAGEQVPGHEPPIVKRGGLKRGKRK